MSKSVSWRQRLVAGAAALAMTLSVAPVAPVAAFAEDAADVPEWAVDDGENNEVFPQATLPAKYDLRSAGLVTPVKQQGPWGSCWAFGGIAAAESSLLSAAGTTYADAPLDLSERHLVYFAQHPVSELENPDQVGEGVHLLVDGSNAEFNSGGGLPIYITTLFSQGIGPVAEQEFPYMGATGRTKLDDLNEDPEGAVWAELEASFPGMTHEEIAEQKYHTTDIPALVNRLAEVLRPLYTESITYSKNDDWTIPATDSYGNSNRLKSGGFVLTDGNILPEYYNADGSRNPDSERAMKQEILNGRAVSIGYFADQSGKYSKEGKQYVDTPQTPPMNHAVCIVGWDDTYSRENFKIVDKDGNEVRPTPPEDGAWIFKNSWGSETDRVEVSEGSYLNNGAVGIEENGKHTGYFYLSYCDVSIQKPETMAFAANLIDNNGKFFTLQHDYAPARAGFATVTDHGASNVISAANVFSTDETAIELRSVASRTTETNMRVTFSIYGLNDGAKDPADGQLLRRFSRNFEYGGIHRVDLDQPLIIGKNKKFSVVTTTSRIEPDGSQTYVAATTAGFDEAMAQRIRLNFYIETVLNEGESYLYRQGKWQDLKAASPSMMTGAYADMTADNFSIKAYGVVAEEETMGGATRIYGENALDTMSAIVSASNFSKGGTVVLTTVDGYWDALTASGIAGLTGAPVVMTSGTELSSQTADVLKRLEPKRIIICGGELAISKDVATAAGDAAGGAEVVRMAGENAADTAVAIYTDAKQYTPAAWSNEAFLCTNDGYWDALAVSPISYKTHMPIFLSNGSESVSDATIKAMKDGGISKVHIVGGEIAISPAVEKQLKAAGIELADRIAGENALYTSAAAAAFGLSRGMTADGMGVASADGYYDALSGGPFCGKNNSVLVLVSSPQSPTITSFITDHATSINGVYVFGGPLAVSEGTFNAVTKAVG